MDTPSTTGRVFMTPAEFRAARKSLGLSVRQAADFLNVDVRTYRRWEADPESDTGARPPHPTACLLMRMALRRPAIITEALAARSEP